MVIVLKEKNAVMMSVCHGFYAKKPKVRMTNNFININNIIEFINNFQVWRQDGANLMLNVIGQKYAVADNVVWNENKRQFVFYHYSNNLLLIFEQRW